MFHRPCPACGSNAPHPEVSSKRRGEDLPFDELRRYWYGLFGQPVFFSYARCDTCALLYAPEFLTADQLAELYADMKPNMQLVANDALAATQRGYWDVAAFGQALDGGYLEIGPDIGYIVGHAATQAAFDHFWLVEPNRAVHAELAASTAGKPHSILTDLDDLSPVPDGSVGLAVMVHVLDHLLDPMASLANILAKLQPGGRVMIVTHNEHSLLRRVMRKRWPPFCLQHPQLFNPESITQLLKRAGYDRIAVERSRNVFPLDFMARQAAYGVGVNLSKVPLPKTPIGLKLGNMITVAHRPA